MATPQDEVKKEKVYELSIFVLGNKAPMEDTTTEISLKIVVHGKENRVYEVIKSQDDFILH